MLRPNAAIIVSSSGLVRELIADWLRMRFGSRVVASHSTPESCQSPLPAADLLIWDARDFHSGAIDGGHARLAALSPEMRIAIIRDQDSTLSGAIASIGISAAPTAIHEKLTPLETEVLLAVASGMRNAEIARRMRRSSKTVEKHRANLQRKLGLRTVAQLTAYALQTGMLDAESILNTR